MLYAIFLYPPDLCFRCYPERAWASAGDVEQPGRQAGRHLQEPDHHPRSPLPPHQGQLTPVSFDEKFEQIIKSFLSKRWDQDPV